MAREQVMKKTVEDSEWSLSAVPASMKVQGLWAAMVVLVGFTFFSPSMTAGGNLGIGLNLEKFFFAMILGNAFLGVCHSMAHKLGGMYHIPHGLANAMLICEVIRFNATDVPTKQGTFPQYKYPNAKAAYANIATYCGLGGRTDDEKIEKLIEAIEKLKTELEIPKSIKEYGIDEATFLAQLDELALKAFDDQCTGANPRYPLVSEIKEMLLKVYYGAEYTGHRAALSGEKSMAM